MPKNQFFCHIFFSKIGLRHILGIAILHFCAKNQKKTNEPISRKAGNRRTNERTNGRTNGRTKVNLKDLRGRSNKRYAEWTYLFIKRMI